jgi:hypothetical protein
MHAFFVRKHDIIQQFIYFPLNLNEFNFDITMQSLFRAEDFYVRVIVVDR